MTNCPESQVNLRNLVLTMLMETEQRKSHLVLKETLDRQSTLQKQQRAFVTRLYQGTLERRIELDYIINQFSKTKTGKMKPVILHILRMSVYQLKYMRTVPVSAVCNEAVKLTIKRKLTGLKGFVNGVVRNIARNLEDVAYPDDEMELLSIIYSMPLWLVKMWSQAYGKDKTEEILKSFYQERSTSVRCNTTKAPVEEIIKSLEYCGVTVSRSPLYKEALWILGYDRLSELKVFQAGMITVQDISSMMAGLAGSPKEGDYIVDVCAAPGGKSLHMAELLKGTGRVEARDLTSYKVGLIEENIRRIGTKNIIAKVYDATVFDESLVDRADIVMADLPCSGLGVIGKKSDIKYHITPSQIEELAALQRNILKVVSRYVKPGGRLVFSTCTVNPKENDENVRWIEENLPFHLKSLKGILPEQIAGEEGYLQIFPGEFGMDGFFISVFERVCES